jgi:hypothetical protein
MEHDSCRTNGTRLQQQCANAKEDILEMIGMKLASVFGTQIWQLFLTGQTQYEYNVGKHKICSRCEQARPSRQWFAYLSFSRTQKHLETFHWFLQL